MGKGKVIIFFLIIAVIIGICVFNYISKEKPQIEQAQTSVNIAISISDSNTPDKLLSVPYEIRGLDTSFFSSGNSSSSSPILVKVPYNFTYNLFAIPNDGKKYYSSSSQFSTSSLDNKQLHLFLLKSGNVDLSSNTSLASDNLNLNLKLRDRNNYYQNVIICVKWGLNIVRINFPSNYYEVPTPELYKNVDKCYYTGISLNSTNTEDNIQFSLKKVGILTPRDFLNVYVIDSDLVNNNYVTAYLGQDVGGGNEEFDFNY
jgi:hypothetical protein